MLQVVQSRSTCRSKPSSICCARIFIWRRSDLAPERDWRATCRSANHAKFWMVDSRISIRADNLYPVDLQEFGYIVDDRTAQLNCCATIGSAVALVAGGAVSGDDAPRCVLRGRTKLLGSCVDSVAVPSDD